MYDPSCVTMARLAAERVVSLLERVEALDERLGACDSVGGWSDDAELCLVEARRQTRIQEACLRPCRVRMDALVEPNRDEV